MSVKNIEILNFRLEELCKMEAVQSFNQELASLYEVKPPISKAKMTFIAKGAIRAIKFYKHVVQSVEKFLQKCKPEYKIPGLYVIDSIVRQSRHQFGPDNDVFAPRFAKNAQITFYHLYKCSEEEKSKVIRVLNLWQKNNVFHSDTIQPLFDMANPQSEIYKNLDQQMRTTGKIVVAGSTPVKEERREAKKERSESGRDNGVPPAQQQQVQQPPQPSPQQFTIPGLGGPPPPNYNNPMGGGGGSHYFMGAPPPGFPPHMQHSGPPGYPSHPPPMGGFGPPPGFGPPRQSPLEEGEHAGDTDDDVMMIDEIGVGGDRRSRGGKDRRRSQDRRSRSRSGSRGKKNRRRGERSKSRSRSRDRRGKRRSRSRERDREDKKRRQEDEKRELERMEERKKKGLPPLKDGHLTGII